MPATPALEWDLFCRVIDNLGDAGVCWRLAADLASRGQRVRLVIDDPAPLAFITPAGTAGVEVLPWPGPAKPGQVVVEAFGCDPPPAFVDAMAAQRPAATWINLEYLSAEPYVERSHGLPSPQPNGLTKWFFYPGFAPRTGGLLREPGLEAARRDFDRQAWFAAQGIGLRPGERAVSLFCYANPALPAMLDDLARAPTLLLLTPGPAQQQVTAAPPGVRLHRLPWLIQADYDRLLWACELNFVRGEDSLVRGVWAGAPLVWQIYSQDDDAHLVKLEAMADSLIAGAGVPGSTGSAVAALWRAWNRRRGPIDWPGLPEVGAWRDTLQPARRALLGREDLVTALQNFVAGQRKACE